MAGPGDSDRQALDRGLEALGIPARAGQCEDMLSYLDELRRWNRSYNLVAAGELPHLLHRHLLDSLVIKPFVQGPRLLDVGSGAGFPGLPLAIVEPDLAVTLLDSAGKKIRFLNHVVRSLGLKNVMTVAERVENFSPAAGFSTIVSRAFATVPEFLRSVSHLARPGMRLLAMKGRHPGTELDKLPDTVRLESVTRLVVPGLDAERHLVVMSLQPQ